MSDTFQSSEIKRPLAYGVMPPDPRSVQIDVNVIVQALQPLLQISTIVSNLSTLISIETGQSSLIANTNTILTASLTALNDIKTKLDTSIVSLQAIQTSTSAIQTSTANIDTKFDVNLSTRASEATLISVNTEVNEVEQAVLGLSLRNVTVLDVLGEIRDSLNLLLTHATLLTEEETVNSEKL